ncbi:hypothetical protein BH18THE2_BH18THE2_15210 [soil metagenome]
MTIGVDGAVVGLGEGDGDGIGMHCAGSPTLGTCPGGHTPSRGLQVRPSEAGSYPSIHFPAIGVSHASPKPSPSLFF